MQYGGRFREPRGRFGRGLLEQIAAHRWMGQCGAFGPDICVSYVFTQPIIEKPQHLYPGYFLICSQQISHSDNLP